jgi:tetratricopeptide (TPR) repeat protein
MSQIKTALLTFFTLALFIPLQVEAQNLELPSKSPKASISYTMGYTDININYSAPAVRGRDIWGKLVSYDKVWRAGANKATTVEFSTPVKVGREREELAAGKYSFFVIPKEEGSWTVVFNKVHDQWGSYEYDESQDAARVEAKPRFAGNTERLSYEIVDQGLGRGYILLSWSDLKLVVFVSTDAYDDMKKRVEEAVAAAPEDQKGGIYANAADVLIDLDDKRDQGAMAFVDMSVEKGATPYNHWVKAKILAVQEDYAGAVETAKKAMELGEANPEDRFYKNYKGTIERGIARWEAEK